MIFVINFEWVVYNSPILIQIGLGTLAHGHFPLSSFELPGLCINSSSVEEGAPKTWKLQRGGGHSSLRVSNMCGRPHI